MSQRNYRDPLHNIISLDESVPEDRLIVDLIDRERWMTLKADVKDVLRQYGRYFISPAMGDRFADGLLALEKNWDGPVLDNAGIDETLKHFQGLLRLDTSNPPLPYEHPEAISPFSINVTLRPLDAR